MARRGAGIGLVTVLLVMAIVMILAAKAWLAVAPTAQQVMQPGRAGSVPAHGDTKAAEAAKSGDLPDLEEMKRQTDRHAEDVKKAAQQAQ